MHLSPEFSLHCIAYGTLRYIFFGVTLFVGDGEVNKRFSNESC